MSAVIVSHSTRSVKTTVELPASKSISNRALVMRHLNPAITLHNLSEADDTRIMLRALEQQHGILHTGNAGTCMRFLTALFASTDTEVTLLCDERMKQRPIGPLVDMLRQAGAEISYQEREGYPPLQIRGRKLAGGLFHADASQSSQYLSALLLAAPYFTSDSVFVMEGDPVSESYIGMTISLMQQAGVGITKERDHIHVKAGGYRTATFTIEPDWSAASYWYEIAAMSETCEIVLAGLSRQSVQGDAAIAAYMKYFGVSTTETIDGLLLRKTAVSPGPLQLDMGSTPDLVPALAVTAAALGIETRFSRIAHLSIQETDRITALQNELQKQGATVASTADELSIHSHPLQTTVIPVNTYNDHRMAMSFAPLALRSGSIRVLDPGVVNKSYPGYWNDLERAGFVLQQV